MPNVLTDDEVVPTLPSSVERKLLKERSAADADCAAAYAAYDEHFDGPVTTDIALTNLAQLEADNLRLAEAHRKSRRVEGRQNVLRRRWICARARRPVGVRRPRQACGGRRRPGARRANRTHAPPGGDADPGGDPDGESPRSTLWRRTGLHDVAGLLRSGVVA